MRTEGHFWYAHVEGTFGVRISGAGWVVGLGHVQDMLVPGGLRSKAARSEVFTQLCAALGSNCHVAPDCHYYYLVNRQVLAYKHYIVGDSYSILLAPYIVLKTFKHNLPLPELLEAACYIRTISPLSFIRPRNKSS